MSNILRKNLRCDLCSSSLLSFNNPHTMEHNCMYSISTEENDYLCVNCNAHYMQCENCSTNKNGIPLIEAPYVELNKRGNDTIYLCQFLGFHKFPEESDTESDTEDDESDTEDDCEGIVDGNFVPCGNIISRENLNIRYAQDPQLTGPDGGYPTYWRCYRCNNVFKETDK